MMHLARNRRAVTMPGYLLPLGVEPVRFDPGLRTAQEIATAMEITSAGAQAREHKNATACDVEVLSAPAPRGAAA